MSRILYIYHNSSIQLHKSLQKFSIYIIHEIWNENYAGQIDKHYIVSFLEIGIDIFQPALDLAFLWWIALEYHLLCLQAAFRTCSPNWLAREAQFHLPYWSRIYQLQPVGWYPAFYHFILERKFPYWYIHCILALDLLWCMFPLTMKEQIQLTSLVW